MHSNTSRANADESQALHSVIEKLRQVIERSNTLHAPVAALQQLSDKLDDCLVLMAPHSGNNQRAMGYYNLNHGEQLNDLQPYSPFIGEYNPIAPRLVCRGEGNKVIGEVTLSGIYEGPPNACHGGIISGIYDQLLATAGTIQGKAGPTAYLHIDYKNITPLYQPVRFEVWVDRIEGKKIFVKGHSYCGEKLLSEAEALFINTLFSEKMPKET